MNELLAVLNEWCGNCDLEDIEVLVTGSPECYEWTCPRCGYEHTTLSDDEIAAELADYFKPTELEARRAA